jgi:hypothetical protein
MESNQDKKDQLNDLMDCRDNIVDSLAKIQTILRVNFPKEYEKAIQFYIPQIVTALYEDKKWLSRGEYSLQNTIDNLVEWCKNDQIDKSIEKYI